MKNLQECLAGVSGGKILDVATGRGEFIEVLVDALQDYVEIIGIDSSERFLLMAKEHFVEGNIYFMPMDAESLEFADASFDMVSISNSLHHMPNLDKTMAEMMRVLKPGGIFIISEMYSDGQNEAQLSHVYLHHWTAKIDRLLCDTHSDTFTRQEILEIVKKLNLCDLKIEDYFDPDDDPKNPEGLAHVNMVLEKSIERIKDYPEYEQIKAEGVRLKEYVEEFGISGCTKLILLGQK